MSSRRAFLTSVSGGLSGAFAGCTSVTKERESVTPEQTSSEDLNTPGDPDAEPESNEDKIDIELPGEPKRISNGRLPVYHIQEAINKDATGFNTGLGNGSERVRTNRKQTRLSFTPAHEGTGQASGYATGTYQTAWTAPETGKYQLKAMFNRWGEFRYDLPQAGELMTSYDVNVQMVNYDTSTVVANQRFPQSLQSSNQQASSEIGEFLVETALTALVGYSLGLGIVARVVLHQVIDELIDLNSPSRGGSQYDVVTRVEKGASPLNIGGPFEVTQDTTAIFEISPMLSWSYRLNESLMNPQFDTAFDMHGFWVEQIE